MKVRKGQKVKVVAGKYKGSEGFVTKVLPKKNLVFVEGVNVKKKAVKKENADSSDVGFIYIQHPIHVSNVRVVSESNNGSE